MSEHPSERVLVIIPCHNEAGRVPAVIASLQDALPAATVLVIDDASTDDTRAVARAARAVVLTHAINLGYGAALETGYAYALEHHFTFTLQMDGDGQHLATELATLLEPLRGERADIVIGSRFLGGRTDYKMPWARRLGANLFSRLIRLCSRQHFTDPTSGFQGLSQSAVQLYASGVLPRDYPDADMLLLAHFAGLRITEVPVSMLQRTGGTSMHSGLSSCYYAVKMLLSVPLAD